ncbi:MAG: matrixin family metalloprotease [bacterium]|nr:matrixin family metalloprotease [bacterium]
MNRKSYLIPLCLLLGLLLLAGSASAYTLLSPHRVWSSPPTYTVDSGGLASINDADGGATKVKDAIKSSAAWNGAGCGNVVNAVKGSVSGFSLGDGNPMIKFSDPFNDCIGNCVAVTYVSYYTSYGHPYKLRIYDADIVTHSSMPFTSQGEDPGGSGCSDEIYIESVMVHEVGHALGLGHNYNARWGTMYDLTYYCEDHRSSIETDDRNAIRATAPPPVVSSSCENNCDDDYDYCMDVDPWEWERCEYDWWQCMDQCMCS